MADDRKGRGMNNTPLAPVGDEVSTMTPHQKPFRGVSGVSRMGKAFSVTAGQSGRSFRV